jgi:hypothetical protein
VFVRSKNRLAISIRSDREYRPISSSRQRHTITDVALANVEGPGQGRPRIQSLPRTYTLRLGTLNDRVVVADTDDRHARRNLREEIISSSRSQTRDVR